MAKSPSKAAEQAEVIDDSEEEQSSKKKDDPAAKTPDDEEGEEEEYEIEAILDAKVGAFGGGRMGYFVKWKGYTSEHNSWVNDEDAQGATQMIEEYWEKTRKNNKNKPKQAKARSARKSDAKASSPDADTPSSSNKRKKTASAAPRKSKSTQPEADEPMEEDEEDKPKTKKTKPAPRAEEEMDIDPTPTDAEDHETEYLPMDITKYKEKSWEKLVQRVDTIEKIDGILKVFFTLNNGEKIVETSRTCAKHFPQKLIQFYESNLRWRESELL